MQSSALFAKQYPQRTNDNFEQTKCVSMRKRGAAKIHTMVKVYNFIQHSHEIFLTIYFILLRKWAKYGENEMMTHIYNYKIKGIEIIL